VTSSSLGESLLPLNTCQLTCDGKVYKQGEAGKPLEDRLMAFFEDTASNTAFPVSLRDLQRVWDLNYKGISESYLGIPHNQRDAFGKNCDVIWNALGAMKLIAANEEYKIAGLTKAERARSELEGLPKRPAQFNNTGVPAFWSGNGFAIHNV
jgi:hypothetical protein